MKVILTIAGSDPSGGAGIQADIKTITSIGSYAAAVITAITCQNSLGVSLISPLAPALVQGQINAVLEDLPVSHIKIGMTGTPAIIAAIQECLVHFTGEIILDPVLKSSSGTSLLSDNPAALSPLIAQATVLTPNSHELNALSEHICTNQQESIVAGEHLLTTFPNLKAICLKGGHLHEEQAQIADVLIFRDNEAIKTKTVCHKRYQTKNSHGTGCTFGSAFTSFHALYGDYEQAFSATVDYVDSLMEQGQHDHLGQGTGPLVHYRMNNES